jgi:hypothetical protein
MNPAIFLAISLLGSQAGATVAIPVAHDHAYAIETRIHRWRQTGEDAPRTSDQHLRVEVQPTRNGFKSVWRDLDAPERTPMQVETNERLIPVRMTNLDAVWAERGLALVRMSATDAEGAESIFQTLPDNGRQALLFKDAILVATAQGLAQRVGEPVVQRLPGQTIGNSPPVEVLSTITLVSADRATGKAVVTWTTELNPDSVAAALPATLRAVLGLTQADTDRMEGFDALMARSSMKNTRTCRYDIDLPTGLAETAVCSDVLDINLAGHRQKTEGRIEARQRLIP